MSGALTQLSAQQLFGDPTIAPGVVGGGEQEECNTSPVLGKVTMVYSTVGGKDFGGENLRVVLQRRGGTVDKGDIGALRKKLKKTRHAKQPEKKKRVRQQLKNKGKKKKRA